MNEYHNDYFSTELANQKAFFTNYNFEKSTNPAISDYSANPMTVRTISIQHALTDLLRVSKLIEDARVKALEYTPNANAILIEAQTKSGSMAYYSGVGFAGSFCPSTSGNLDGFYKPYGTYSVYKSAFINEELILLFDLQAYLYSFFLGVGSCLDRMVREIVLLYGEKTTWDDMNYYNVSKLDQLSQVINTDCRNGLSILLTQYCSDLRDAVQIRHQFAHRGYVVVEKQGDSFYFNCTIPASTGTPIIPPHSITSDVFVLSKHIYCKCINFLDKGYEILKNDLRLLVS